MQATQARPGRAPRLIDARHLATEARGKTRGALFALNALLQNPGRAEIREMQRTAALAREVLGKVESMMAQALENPNSHDDSE